MTINKKSTKINLIETWITAAKNHVHGYGVKDALGELNQTLGKNYDINRLGKWRRGYEAVPQPVQDYMLRDVIYDVLADAGLVTAPDEVMLDRIAAMLTPPVRE